MDNISQIENQSVPMNNNKRRILSFVAAGILFTGIVLAAIFIAEDQVSPSTYNNSTNGSGNTQALEDRDFICQFESVQNVVDGFASKGDIESNLAKMYFKSERDGDTFLLEMNTERMLSKLFMVAAMYGNGSLPAEYHMAAETNMFNTFKMELADDAKGVDLFQAKLNGNAENMEWVLVSTFRIWALQPNENQADNGTMTCRKLVLSSKSFLISGNRWLNNGFFVYESLAPAVQDDVQFSKFGTFSKLLIDASSTFEKNMEVVVFQSEGFPTATPPRVEEFVLRYSLRTLPENEMEHRKPNARIGYFTTVRQMLQEDVVPMEQGQLISINRKRLDYDPGTRIIKKPLLYYIDPSVPEKWRNAVKSGVEAWNVAFQMAGFQETNTHPALKALQEGDDEWPNQYHASDLRYSSISWSPDNEAWAIGPSNVDIRSGEIINSDIVIAMGWLEYYYDSFQWYSNAHADQVNNTMQRHDNICQNVAYTSESLQFVGMLNHSLANASMDDYVLSQTVLEQAIKSIIMHEVGHTLGLRHNFIASTARTMDQLKDKSFTETYGLSSSIMDYLPPNTHAGEQDLSQYTLFQPSIGEYDVWAIQYGYAPVATEEDLEAIANSQSFAYATDEDMILNGALDPLVNVYDLAEPWVYFDEKLDIIKSIQEKLMVKLNPLYIWDAESRLLNEILKIGQILGKYIGGMHVYPTQTATESAVEFFNKDRQLNALQVLLRIILAEDGLFLPPSLYTRMVFIRQHCDYMPDNTSICLEAASATDYRDQLNNIRYELIYETLLSPGTIWKLSNYEWHINDTTSPMVDYFNTLTSALFENPSTVSNVDAQRSYLERLLQIIDIKDSMISTSAKAAAIQQVEKISAKMSASSDENRSFHKLFLQIIEKAKH